MKNDIQKSAASVFKAIDNKLKLPGGGCSDSIAYMEQSSWLLFLRYLDGREAERKNEAMVLGRPYTPALPKELAWSTWAYPVDKDGNFDRDNAAISADAECALPIRPVMCECHEHEGSPDAVGAH